MSWAGFALAAMNVPQALGSTRIAGTPVITGLYTLLLPLVAFVVFLSFSIKTIIRLTDGMLLGTVLSRSILATSTSQMITRGEFSPSDRIVAWLKCSRE